MHCATSGASIQHAALAPGNPQQQQEWQLRITQPQPQWLLLPVTLVTQQQSAPNQPQHLLERNPPQQQLEGNKQKQQPERNQAQQQLEGNQPQQQSERNQPQQQWGHNHSQQQ